MAFTNPTVADFKAYFTRDFVYGVDNTTVTDNDISKALNLCAINFNPELFAYQSTYTIGFLLLTAHYMCMELRAATQGINGQFTWAMNSRAVGNVSEGITIPQRIIDNPEWMYFTKTNYGAEYLSLVLPQFSGQVFTVCGRTRA